MLPRSQRALILVLDHMGNFGVRSPPGCSRYGISVQCAFKCYAFMPQGDQCFQNVWKLVCYAVIVGCSVGVMLCRCKVIHLKVWVLCQCGRAA